MSARYRLGLGLAVVFVLMLLFYLGVTRWGGARAGEAPCGPGFVRDGVRCRVSPGGPCPSPLVMTEANGGGCDEAVRDVVAIPATTIVVGPSDWEAEGRVAPRTAKVGRFAIDRLEVTVGRACASPAFRRAPLCERRRPDGDSARAAFGVTLDEARAYCRERGGRLPTEDEWLAAAAGPGDRGRRYPWGDTGAVCRRAAWGLLIGPCGEGADGPDTVGSHPDGASPLGVQDLAGNVGEWTETFAGGAGAVVHGGTWEASIATDLRTWARMEAAPDARAHGIGFRCAYDEVP